MARVVDRAPSRGHGDRFDAIVWVNEAGRAAWESGADMPAGAMLVEEAIGRTAKGDRAAGLLVMQKTGEGWRFLVIDDAGVVVKDGQEDRCAACHAEAPRGGVFRLK
jgi:hypothetical protein